MECFCLLCMGHIFFFFLPPSFLPPFLPWGPVFESSLKTGYFKQPNRATLEADFVPSLGLVFIAVIVCLVIRLN